MKLHETRTVKCSDVTEMPFALNSTQYFFKLQCLSEFNSMNRVTNQSSWLRGQHLKLIRSNCIIGSAINQTFKMKRLMNATEMLFTTGTNIPGYPTNGQICVQPERTQDALRMQWDPTSSAKQEEATTEWTDKLISRLVHCKGLLPGVKWCSQSCRLNSDHPRLVSTSGLNSLLIQFPMSLLLLGTDFDIMTTCTLQPATLGNGNKSWYLANWEEHK